MGCILNKKNKYGNTNLIYIRLFFKFLYKCSSKEWMNLKNHKKVWIILSCIVIIAGAFGYGYYSAFNKKLGESAQKKPTINLDSVNNDIPEVIGEEEGVSKFPPEDRVSPYTMLIEKIVSVNTGSEMEKEPKVVPDEIVNYTEEQVKNFFKGYDSVEFSPEKIVLLKKMPFLPDGYVVKLEDKYIKVFITDSTGKASLCGDFEPVPHKNKDQKLEQGIEVDSPDKVYEIIQDYE